MNSVAHNHDELDALKARPIHSMFPLSMSPDDRRQRQFDDERSRDQMNARRDEMRVMARAKAREVSKANSRDRDGPLTLQDRSQSLPQFADREVQLGPLLGKGGFCSVFEVAEFVNLSNGKKLPLDASLRNGNNNRNNKDHTTDAGHVNHPAADRHDAGDEEHVTALVQQQQRQPETRLYLAEHCRLKKTGEALYAVKKISSSTTNNPSQYVRAMLDMATEARILSALDEHPNIIKLHAVSEGADPFKEQYFLVLDRLHGGTLEDRMNAWRAPNLRNAVLFVGAGRRRRNQLDQQLSSATELASALAHLHRHRIVYRDLKPQNVGYNVHDDLTLFDFGLARELPSPPSSSTSNDDGLFKMTGLCGSLRYMAPEVGKKERYNEKCDVYSYAILCWEILSLERAYTGHTLETLEEKVWNAPHCRPNAVGRKNNIGIKTPGEILALTKSYSGQTLDLLEEAVRKVSQLHPNTIGRKNNSGVETPPVTDDDPSSGSLPITGVIMDNIRIQSMLERAWCNDIASRPSMEEIVEVLTEECQKANHPIGATTQVSSSTSSIKNCLPKAAAVEQTMSFWRMAGTM